MFKYPARTQWVDRTTLPDPHAWRLPDNNSWAIKENYACLVAVLLLACGILSWRSRHRRVLSTVVALVFILLLMVPITALMAGNIVLTSVVRSPAIHLDPDVYFPRHRELMQPENLRAIQSEIRALTTKGGITIIPFVEDSVKVVNNSYIGSDRTKNGSDGWRTFILKAAGRISPSAREKAPQTAAILDQFPNIHNAVFSVLGAKTCIPIHVGYSKAYVRAHVGLQVPDPENCVLHVNGEPYHWKENELVLFDDTFPHEVFNASEQPRSVLYMDVVRQVDNPLLQRFIDTTLIKLSNSPITKYITARDERVQR